MRWKNYKTFNAVGQTLDKIWNNNESWLSYVSSKTENDLIFGNIYQDANMEDKN